MFSKSKNRECVSESTPQKLEKRVKQLESYGWRKVGGMTEIHHTYKSEYIQVMEIGR